MSKMPTAKEFFTELDSVIKDIEMLKDGSWVPDEHSCNASIEFLEKTKIKILQFTKLHVEAAIKECIESAPSGSSTDTVSYEDVVMALKDCYSIENIK